MLLAAFIIRQGDNDEDNQDGPIIEEVD